MKETDLLFQGMQLTFLPRKVYVIVIIKTALIFSQQKTDRQHEKNIYQILHEILGVSGGTTMLMKKMTVIFLVIYTLRKKYPYLELLWSVFSRIRTEYTSTRLLLVSITKIIYHLERALLRMKAKKLFFSKIFREM